MVPMRTLEDIKNEALELGITDLGDAEMVYHKMIELHKDHEKVNQLSNLVAEYDEMEIHSHQMAA